MRPSLSSFADELIKVSSTKKRILLSGGLIGGLNLLSNPQDVAGAAREGLGFGVGDEVGTRVADSLLKGKKGLKPSAVRFLAGWVGGDIGAKILRRLSEKKPPKMPAQRRPPMSWEQDKWAMPLRPPQTHLTPASSNVQGFRYDPKSQQLFITFKGGTTYKYHGVPPAVYKSLQRSKSTGKAVNRRVKGGGYEYEKVGGSACKACGKPATKGQIWAEGRAIAMHCDNGKCKAVVLRKIGEKPTGEPLKKHATPYVFAPVLAGGLSESLSDSKSLPGAAAKGGLIGAGLGGLAGLGLAKDYGRSGTIIPATLVGALLGSMGSSSVHQLRKEKKESFKKKAEYEASGPPKFTGSQAHAGGKPFVEERTGLLRERVREGVGKHLAKQANGDMMEYYQKHPKKWKERQERLQAKKNRKAKKRKPTWGKNLTATQRFVLSRGGSLSKKAAPEPTPQTSEIDRLGAAVGQPLMGPRLMGEALVHSGVPVAATNELAQAEAAEKTAQGVGSRAPGFRTVGGSVVPDDAGESFVAEKVRQRRRQIEKMAGAAKKTLTWNGLTMKFEYLTGDTRSGVNGTTGKKWSRTMRDNYGYMPGTYGKGADGEALDVYFPDKPVDGPVYRLDQKKKDGSFDEHKYFVGYGSAEDARKAFRRNMPEWAMGPMTSMPLRSFRRLVGQKEPSGVPFDESRQQERVQKALKG